MTTSSPIELVCPAGSLPALKTAIDHGADCVYLGFKDATNARNFSGLNFDPAQMREGIAYAHARGKKVLLAHNTYPQTGNWPSWIQAIDRAAEFGLDAERQGLFGHSMGGHGALTLAMSLPGRFQSVSAFAPIANPTASDWGRKQFAAYLGMDEAKWPAHDATFAARAFGCTGGETVAGIVHIGTPPEDAPDRPRPDLSRIVSWVDA